MSRRVVDDALKEIEKTQDQLRQSIEQSRELAEKSDRLIRAHHREMRGAAPGKD